MSDGSKSELTRTEKEFRDALAERDKWNRVADSWRSAADRRMDQIISRDNEISTLRAESAKLAAQVCALREGLKTVAGMHPIQYVEFEKTLRLVQDLLATPFWPCPHEHRAAELTAAMVLGLLQASDLEQREDKYQIPSAILARDSRMKALGAAEELERLTGASVEPVVYEGLVSGFAVPEKVIKQRITKLREEARRG